MVAIIHKSSTSKVVLQKPGYPLQSGDINEPHAITGIAQSIKEEADEFFETFEFPMRLA